MTNADKLAKAVERLREWDGIKIYPGGTVIALVADIRTVLSILNWQRTREDSLVEAAIEAAAKIADGHWSESGHSHEEGTASCAMSTSIMIRRLTPESIRAAVDAKERK